MSKNFPIFVINKYNYNKKLHEKNLPLYNKL